MRQKTEFWVRRVVRFVMVVFILELVVFSGLTAHHKHIYAQQPQEATK